MADGNLLALSDLHVGYPENRPIVQGLTPRSPGDWLLVAGDVAEKVADLAWVLELLQSRFATVVWTPGNHELWTTREDSVQLRGVERYLHLVEICRSLGVLTPEDPFPRWTGPGGPLVVAPLFLLYDYTFRPNGATSKEEALAIAHRAGVVCTDEYLLKPEPYRGVEQWCRDRVAYSRARLSALAGQRSVLLSHWPLIREPTRLLRYPEFALWCGTELSARFHIDYNAAAVVYGHLHIPQTSCHDNVRFEEVSVGYPREWRWYRRDSGWLRQVLPAAA